MPLIFLCFAQIETLEANNPTPNPASSPLMTGRWNMAWTTEKEILFLVEKGFFGLRCLSVYQVLSLTRSQLRVGPRLDNADAIRKRKPSKSNPKGSKRDRARAPARARCPSLRPLASLARWRAPSAIPRSPLAARRRIREARPDPLPGSARR